jgi:hypothetical protein
VLEEYVAMTTRWSRVAAVMAAIGLGAGLSSASAGAVGLTAFSMSPTSGPAGTEVSVSGTGCAPGLLLSSSLDRVVVHLASVPPVSVPIPVTSGGAWNGTVTVPANAAAAAAPVTAVCFTDGLQSLLTIYTPRTFTVTAAAPPSTTTPGTQPAPTTTPDGTQEPPVTPTPTTDPGGSQTTGPDGGGPVAGIPGGGSGAPGSNASDPSAGSDDAGASAGAKKTASGPRADAVSVAADLQAPDLTSTGAADGGSGLGWIGWTALFLLAAGALAGALLVRRYRESEAPAEA